MGVEWVESESRLRCYCPEFHRAQGGSASQVPQYYLVLPWTESSHSEVVQPLFGYCDHPPPERLSLQPVVDPRQAWTAPEQFVRHPPARLPGEANHPGRLDPLRRQDGFLSRQVSAQRYANSLPLRSLSGRIFSER